MQKWEQNHEAAEPDLPQPLDRQQMTLHYLPLVDLQSGKWIGAEVLLVRNFLEMDTETLPADRIATQNRGEDESLEKWVLHMACIQNRQWQEAGITPFVVSVDISAPLFLKEDFVQTVEHILMESRLPARYLELTITEAVTSKAEHSLDIFIQLKQLGVQICLKEFGKGLSCLQQWSRIPLSRVNIDRTFVQQFVVDQQYSTVVKMIIGIAKNLQVRVTAEGVETAEQLHRLQHFSCDSAQGKVLSGPVSAEQLQKEWMRAGKRDESESESTASIEPVRQRATPVQTQEELFETLRNQQGMTFSFRKQGNQFIHTLCQGELLYRIGLTPEQVVGKPLLDILPAAQAVRKERYYERAWAGEDNVNYEGYVNGVYYLAALRPIFQEGIVQEVIASCVDITELKKAEEEKRISEAKFRLIAENMSDVIVILDRQFLITYVSPSVNQVLEVTPEAILHQSILSFLSDEEGKKVEATLREIMLDKHPKLITFTWGQQEGRRTILEAKGTPVLHDCGEDGQIIFVIRNVTAQLQAEEFLRKMEKLSVVGQLAAGVAHEIRNPVTSIKGFVQLLRRDQGKKEYFDIMLQEFQQLESILREFVFLTQQHSNHYELTNVGEMIRSITSCIQAETDSHKLELSLQVAEEQLMWCDPGQIKQVISHLLTNAIESMPEGGIILILVRPEGEDKVMIRIVDYGCGMSEERLKRIGEPFYSTKEKGTGLGLMISYKIIENHDGYIHFCSEPNKGTTVEVYFPMKHPLPLSAQGGAPTT
ncbi:EAL domain-containing protein [Brevibacillus reuszeri]|uniref:EAL domain-containing protein n=1 Tax=Brevibacillus reuszeri TaxID=54915 RepID=UPI00289F7D72|nr:EAL domain-containing protein [Brevibacillus reuszeri]